MAIDEVPDMSLATGLDVAAKVIAVAGGLSLIAAVTIDWGYLSAFGVKLFEVPTTIGDHLRSGLNYIPTLIAIFMLCAWIYTIDPAFQANSKWKFEGIPLAFHFYPFGLAALAWWGSGESPDLGLPAAILASCLWWASFLLPRLAKQSNRVASLLLAVVPAVLGVAFIVGRLDAMTVIEESDKRLEITVGQTTEEVAAIRLFDKGALYLNRQGKVVFTAWGEIKSYGINGSHSPNKGSRNARRAQKSASSP